MVIWLQTLQQVLQEALVSCQEVCSVQYIQLVYVEGNGSNTGSINNMSLALSKISWVPPRCFVGHPLFLNLDVPEVGPETPK